MSYADEARKLRERVHPEEAAATERQVTDARLWMHEMYGHSEGQGNVLFALCDRDGEWDELLPFRVDRPPFAGKVPDHATMLDSIAASAVQAASVHDVYACPYLHARRRRRGGAVLREHVHADIDGPLDPDEVRSIGGFAVSSGTEGHGQVFVRLNRSVEPREHRALCHALGQVVGGEHHDEGKVSDNDVLRPAGTLNHKTDPPRPVTWLVRPDEARTWDPEDLARTLGVPWPVVEPEEVVREATVPLDDPTIQRRLDGLARSVTDAPEKDGNEALNWASGVAAALLRSAPPEQAEQMRERLVEAFLARPIPSGETPQGRRAEATATIASGWKWGQEHPTEALRESELKPVAEVSEHPVVPPIPDDIEQCPIHGHDTGHSCGFCIVVRPQLERYGRTRAVALEVQTMASDDAWRPVNLMDAPALEDPTVMVAEGVEGADEPLPLIRRGMVGSVYGLSGYGKTTLGYLTGIQVIRDFGGLFLVSDHEMGQDLARDALLDLDLTGEEISEFVIFFDDPPAVSDLYFGRLAEAVQDRMDATGRTELFGVYDSVSRSMGKAPGWSTNDEVNVNAWYDSLPRRVLKEFPSSTHLTIDHPGRTDGPEAIGSHAKGAGPDFRLWVQGKVPFDYYSKVGHAVGQVRKARGVRTYPLNTDLAELVVVEGKVRWRRLPLPTPRLPGELELPLDLHDGGRTSLLASDQEVLTELRARGPILKTAFCGKGDAGTYRRAALARLKDEGLADFVPAGRNGTGQLWSAIESDT